MQKDIELWAKILQESEKPMEERCTEEELAQEAGMSIDDILAANDERQAKQAADAAAVAQANPTNFIREIVITDAKKPDNHMCYVTYDILWSNGKTEKNQVFDIAANEYEFQKAKRRLHSRDDLNVAVALLQQSYDMNSRKPIKWTFFNKKTGLKTDNAQFGDIVNAKKLLSRRHKADVSVDPEIEKRRERAAQLNKAYGSSKVRFSAIEDR